ncbi:MAG: hypothetical protein AABO58_16495 [Acidobacteriota bacterium]
MPDRLPPGPYRTLRLDDGTEVPYYIIPFDKKGRCDGPETRADLIDKMRKGMYTDVFLFSHGWNNDWTVATKRYEDFIAGFMEMRRKHGLKVATPYRPLLVGIFWPSTALVFGVEEEGPAIAAGDPAATDRAVADERQSVRELADQLPDGQVERFYELAQKEALNDAEALELAIIVRPLYASVGDEVPDETMPAPETIVSTWRANAPEPDDLEDFGTAGPPEPGEVQAAGGGLGSLLRRLDPRPIVRALTVRQMKDRAGTVGARGVGALLRDLLSAGKARLHLIGHSYGAKVMLSAIAAGGDLPRPVQSLLLLQPAVSHLCFADQVPGTDHPGGYRKVLARVKRPIFSTFSAHDVPLTKMFHLALRRSDDLGEAEIAAAGEPPSVYAALGGFGPRRAGEKLVDILDVNQPYDLVAGTPIFGIRGTRTISGHGAISNESTWWALYTLASG